MIQPRRAVHQLYLETLQAQYGEELLGSMIPEAADLVEATMLRRPVAWHKPRGASAKALAAEIDVRLVGWARVEGEAA